MACFAVPAAEAIVTAITKNKIDKDGTSSNPFIRKMNWLNNMLWGGSALLAFEHIWHGEVTPWFPFFTNAVNPADAAEMLLEMFTVGTAMAAVVTAAWAGSVIAADSLEKQPVRVKTKGTRGRKR